MWAEKTRISVIIPFYNMGKTLQRCIESVISQTYRELEILLIDDGSTDSSVAICEYYKKKDRRIQVFHQENKGVSVARNVGLDHASGEFIGFIDADDEATPQMYECMVNLALENKTDIVICDSMSVFPDGRIVEDDTLSNLHQSSVLFRCNISVDLLKEMAGSVWKCIYRAEPIVRSKDGIRFIQGMKISEDRVFNLAAFSLAKSIYYVKQPLYKRYILADSTVHKYRKDYYYYIKMAYDKTISTLTKYWDENYLSLAEIEFVEGIVASIRNTVRQDSSLSRKEKKDELKRLCQNEVLMLYLPTTNVDAITKYWIIHRWYFFLLNMDTSFNRVSRRVTRVWMKFDNK